MSERREMAAEMGNVQRALAAARVHFAGLDQADSARLLENAPIYSPLRTLVEQAEKSAERVIEHLRTEPRQ